MADVEAGEDGEDEGDGVEGEEVDQGAFWEDEKEGG